MSDDSILSTALKPAHSPFALTLPDNNPELRHFFARCLEHPDFQRCRSEREQIHAIARWSSDYSTCSERISMQNIADLFEIAKSTVAWHLSKPCDIASGCTSGQNGRPSVLSDDVAESLIKFVQYMFDQRVPCSYEEMRDFLQDEHELVININTLRSWVSRCGRLRTVVGVPMEDTRVFSSEEAIDDFFNNLEEILNVAEIPSAFIMNLDEAGFDQFADRRRTRRIVPTEYTLNEIPTPVSRNEKHATLLACICADGHCMRPLLVLQRETMECELLQLGYTLDKVIYGRSATGYMNTELFLLWAEHSFLPELRDRRAKLGYSGPALLLLDGFGVHHSPPFEAMCQEENVVLMFYPAHTSDQLQPCDLGLFGNQKRWQANISLDQRLNTQTKQCIRILDSLRLATTPKNIIGAFRKSGIVNKYDTATGQLVACVDRACATEVRHFHEGDDHAIDEMAPRARVRI